MKRRTKPTQAVARSKGSFGGTLPRTKNRVEAYRDKSGKRRKRKLKASVKEFGVVGHKLWKRYHK